MSRTGKKQDKMRTSRPRIAYCIVLAALSLSDSNRLLSISAEKFISDIVSDAYQYSRIRTNATTTAGRPAGSGAGGAGGAGGVGGGRGGAGQSGPGSGGGQGGAADKSRTVLTMDDLSAALGEYGINARRADSYR